MNKNHPIENKNHHLKLLSLFNLTRPIILMILIMLSVTSLCHSQTAVWSMPLADYSNVERIAEQTYKVLRGSKYGLIKPKGEIIIGLECDEFTRFHEDKALMLRKENGKKRVLGCFMPDGRWNVFSNTYYTIEGLEFYSDGLLPVEYTNGHKGYIDEKGVAHLDFEPSDGILPFSEGYAAKYGSEYKLFNRSGEEQDIRIDSYAEIIDGTNVYKGIAYVKDGNNHWHIFDVNSKKSTKTKKPSDETFDYLGCLKSVTNRSERPDYYDAPQGAIVLRPTEVDGKFGYTKDGKTVLPPQFSSATAFVDNYAIVQKDGKWGILEYVESETNFSVSPSIPVISYKKGESVKCEFKVIAPDSWDSNKLNVDIQDDRMIDVKVRRENEVYVFDVTPTEANQKRKFQVLLSADQLELHSAEIEYVFKMEEEQIQITDNNKHPDTEKKKDQKETEKSDTYPGTGRDNKK